MLTKEEKIVLLDSLKAEANLLQTQIDSIVREAEKLTAEHFDSFRTFDYIWNDFLTAEELLEKLDENV